MQDIHAVIDRMEEWTGKDITIKEITAGLTNKNYKVTVDGASYVVRIPGEASVIFDREAELQNSIAAAQVGVGAQIIKYFKPDYITIAEFLEGTVMSVEAFEDQERIVKAVRAIKRVNEHTSFISQFIMFDKFDDYVQLVKEHDMRIPDDFAEAEKIVRLVQDRFLRTMPPLVSCHNDLLAENFIDQGDRMRIIDWELSGMNDPCFELGDFSVEQELSDEEDALMMETYFEFDYWNYGMNRFKRAMNAMHSDDFGAWLEKVT